MLPTMDDLQTAEYDECAADALVALRRALDAADPDDRAFVVEMIEVLERDAEERERELGELRAWLDRREQELAEAHGVLILVLRSRVYRMMRALGRWGLLEHRISRVLR